MIKEVVLKYLMSTLKSEVRDKDSNVAYTLGNYSIMVSKYYRDDSNFLFHPNYESKEFVRIEHEFYDRLGFEKSERCIKKKKVSKDKLSIFIKIAYEAWLSEIKDTERRKKEEYL